jgi:nucleosome binding factor SPN SPT16 subunit
MTDVQVDATAFFERLQSLYNAWKADKRSGSGNEAFGGADTIIVLTGKAADETVYVKNNAIHVSQLFLVEPGWHE